jgi:hypothetical protein
MHGKYSRPSSYDWPDIVTTWVTTKILVLTYNQTPKKARKEAKEGRGGTETNHNLFGKYARKIIGVSGKLRTLYNPSLLRKG